MINTVFDLAKEYHFNSLFPLYLALKKDPEYNISFHVPQDSFSIKHIFCSSDQKRIMNNLHAQNIKTTTTTKGFDLLVAGDSLRSHHAYGDLIRVHIDHGVGIKTSRIRNIIKQQDMHYHVFLEGNYWHDYIRSLHWEKSADFYCTGMPKLDPLFWPNYYDIQTLKKSLHIDTSKPTVLFAPSYKPSCIDFIGDRVVDLITDYNVLIKLHPYSWGTKYAPSSHYKYYSNLAKQHREIVLLPKIEYDIYPYLLLADTLISDTSSVLNEFLALGKFGIIYELPHFKSVHSDGMEVLSIDPKEWLIGAFPHISSPDSLISAVEQALHPTKEMQKKHTHYRDYLFTGLDGKSSFRVKNVIDRLMK